MLNSGDEIAQLNGWDYQNDPARADDSRNLHRTAFNWRKAAQRRRPRHAAKPRMAGPGGTARAARRPLLCPRRRRDDLGRRQRRRAGAGAPRRRAKPCRVVQFQRAAADRPPRQPGAAGAGRRRHPGAPMRQRSCNRSCNRHRKTAYRQNTGKQNRTLLRYAEACGFGVIGRGGLAGALRFYGAALLVQDHVAVAVFALHDHVAVGTAAVLRPVDAAGIAGAPRLGISGGFFGFCRRRIQRKALVPQWRPRNRGP